MFVAACSLTLGFVVAICVGVIRRRSAGATLRADDHVLGDVVHQIGWDVFDVGVPLDFLWQIPVCVVVSFDVLCHWYVSIAGG